MREVQTFISLQLDDLINNGKDLKYPFQCEVLVMKWNGPLLLVGTEVYVGGWNAKVTGHHAFLSTGEVWIDCELDESDLNMIWEDHNDRAKLFFDQLQEEGWINAPR